MLAMIGIVASPWNTVAVATRQSSLLSIVRSFLLQEMSEEEPSRTTMTTADLVPPPWSVLVHLSSSSSSASSSMLSGQEDASNTFSLHWDTLSLLQVLQVMIVCGILETQILIPRDPQDIPGDYGVGYFGIRDIGRHERSLVVELEHGRLAMMAFLYWLVVLDPPIPIRITIVQEFYGRMLRLWEVIRTESGAGAAAADQDTVMPDSIVFSSFGQEVAQAVWESTVDLSPPLPL
jgi:Chlorophyll A-B binding protein